MYSLISEIEKTTTVLSQFEYIDRDYKNQSTFNAINGILNILPKDEKFHNTVVYEIANNYSQEYIDNVLRNYYHPNTQESLDILKNEYLKLIEIANIDILGAPINFYSEKWNLEQFWVRGKDKSLYKYTFKNDLGFQFNTLTRMFVMIQLYKFGPHASSTKEKLYVINDFLSYTQNYYNLKELKDIKLTHIKDYIDSFTNVQYNTIVRKKQIISTFFNTISPAINCEIDEDILIYLNDVDRHLINDIHNKNKTPLLPDDFYEKYKNTICNEYLNKELPKNKNKYKEHFELGACALITQSGLRTEELSIIVKNALKKITVGDKHGYYLIYYSTKPSRSKNEPYLIGEMPLNELGVKIYNKLCEEAKIAYPKSKYIFPYLKGSDAFKMSITICCQHALEFGLINNPNPELFHITVKVGDKKYAHHSRITRYYKGDENDFISLPSFKQLRVYVSTYFRRMGATDEEIRKIYIHTAPQMAGYYVRDDHPVQEDLEYSTDTIKNILVEDLSILGPKGPTYKEKINSFINGKDINAKENLDQIIETICNQMPIRSKAGGFCMKSNPNRPCNIDAKTDEFTCAYNMCPNHCFFYYDMPESYNKCKQHLEIIEHNIKCGYLRSAEKEAYLLINEINTCLNITINETEKEIIKHGKNYIINNHPKMEYYVNHLEEIKGEVKLWKTKAKQMAELS